MKLVDSSGGELRGLMPPPAKEYVPFGAMVLVEMLDAKEALGTNLEVPSGAAAGAPQAYILALGPRVTEECGLKVGNRVLLQGSFVPIPKRPEEKRMKGVIDMNVIKAIIRE